jgi:hypothetical protein
MSKNHLEIKVHDSIMVVDSAKAEIEVIVEKVTPDLQKEFPKIRLSKIKEVLEKILITKVADEGIDWVRNNLPKIMEIAEKLLSEIDSLGP